MRKFEIKILCRYIKLKENLTECIRDEHGDVSIISMTCILLVVLSLAIAFRSAVSGLFDSIWETISMQVNDNAGGNGGLNGAFGGGAPGANGGGFR